MKDKKKSIKARLLHLTCFFYISAILSFELNMYSEKAYFIVCSKTYGQVPDRLLRCARGCDCSGCVCSSAGGIKLLEGLRRLSRYSARSDPLHNRSVDSSPSDPHHNESIESIASDHKSLPNTRIRIFLRSRHNCNHS